jgi:hypothetical protein
MEKFEVQKIPQTIIKPSSTIDPILTIKNPEAHLRAFSTYANQSAIITGWGVTESRTTKTLILNLVYNFY